MNSFKERLGIFFMVIGIILIIIGTCHEAHANKLVDDFSESHVTQSNKQAFFATKMEMTTGTELHLPNRELIAYSPLWKKNSALTMISQGELYIDNTIDVTQTSVGNIGINYTFNNDNFNQYTGVLIKSVGMGVPGGRLMASVNGPSGFSYSNLYKFNGSNNTSFKDTGIIFISFTNFNGTKLFNNINSLKIDIIGVKMWSGNMTIELVE